jgi:hypothetical protein
MDGANQVTSKLEDKLTELLEREHEANGALCAEIARLERGIREIVEEMEEPSPDNGQPVEYEPCIRDWAHRLRELTR